MQFGPSRIWTRDVLPTTLPTGFIKNRDYIVLPDGTYYYFNTSWVAIDLPLKGDQGPQGDQGADGLQGPQGEAGPQGIQGPSGSGTPNLGGVRWVTTLSEFKAAIADQNIRCINLAANITLDATIDMSARTGILELEGHGFDITVPATVLTAFSRSYASLSVANGFIDHQLRARNVSFKGSNRASVCFDYSTSYGSKFEGCRFYSFSKALFLKWCMGTIVDQCYFWENGTSVHLDYDRFTGGSNSTSQSNHSVVSNCKFRHSAGQFAAIAVYSASGIEIAHNIFEGVQAGPQYEVFFDDNNSNVVKEVNIHGNHVEQIPSIAAFNIKLKEGFAYISGVYSQYDCTLIRFESSAYGKCVVENIPYLTANTKFENVNTSGRWMIKNMPGSFSLTDAAKWVGTPPINSRLDNWNPSGQTPTINLAGRNL